MDCQELQSRWGWCLAFKHVETSTRARSTLGPGFGAQPSYPQYWKARPAVQALEGSGCFSTGTPGCGGGQWRAPEGPSSPHCLGQPLPEAQPHTCTQLPVCPGCPRLPHWPARCSSEIHTSGLCLCQGPCQRGFAFLPICPSSDSPSHSSSVGINSSARAVGPDHLSPTEVDIPEGRGLHRLFWEPSTQHQEPLSKCTVDSRRV